MTKLPALVALLALSATALAPADTAAGGRPGDTEVVSVGADGQPADNMSWHSAVTPDGRYVAFDSYASNLVPGDPTQAELQQHVFVHDRVTGETEWVSVSTGGEQANDRAAAPVLSADGRYVAFVSWATNLVDEPVEPFLDVYLRDRWEGTTTLVSTAVGGGPADGPSYAPAMTPDGRYLAFPSEASNLIAGDTNGWAHVYLHDRETGETERVSVSSGGAQPNWHAGWPAVSDDGRYVAFDSEADNLVLGDTNGRGDVFVRDRLEGTTERVSVAGDGAEANGWSTQPAMSADGRHVVFSSMATNLVPRDGVRWDVFVHDRETGRTKRVSVSSHGEEGDDWSQWATISPDGRYVGFQSLAGNLVEGDTNDTLDTFVHDRVSRTTERVSVSSAGDEGDHWSSGVRPAITPGGRHVVFASEASTFVPGAGGDVPDIFVRDRGPELGFGALRAEPAGAGGLDVHGWATFSGLPLSAATGSGADVAADALGAAIRETSVVYRPESADLSARIAVDRFPGVRGPSPQSLTEGLPGVSGLPGIVFVLDMVVDGVRYEVRAGRGAPDGLPVTPTFLLYRCQPECGPAGELRGGYGTTGEEVVVTVPLAAVDAGGGTELTALQVRAVVGLIDDEAQRVLDAVDLPDAAVPEHGVSLAAAADADGDQVALTAGRFAVSLPDQGSGPLWARACLAEACMAQLMEPDG